MSSVTKIEWKKKPSSKNAILFSGLPGIGLVGKIVVDYLIKELNVKKVADIYSDSFPASVLNQKGIIAPIVDELYAFEQKGKTIYFLAGPVQPGGDYGGSHFAEHYAFARELVSELRTAGVKEIYTMAGIDVAENELSEKPKIVVAATNMDTLKRFKKVGCQTIEGEGVISGAAGLLLLQAHRHQLSGACLMAETNSKFVYGDPLAAKSLLEIVCKEFKFKVKMDRLDQEIANIETAFKKIQAQIDSRQDASQENLTYVR